MPDFSQNAREYTKYSLRFLKNPGIKTLGAQCARLVFDMPLGETMGSIRLGAHILLDAFALDSGLSRTPPPTKTRMAENAKAHILLDIFVTKRVVGDANPYKIRQN